MVVPDDLLDQIEDLARKSERDPDDLVKEILELAVKFGKPIPIKGLVQVIVDNIEDHDFLNVVVDSFWQLLVEYEDKYKITRTKVLVKMMDQMVRNAEEFYKEYIENEG